MSSSASRARPCTARSTDHASRRDTGVSGDAKHRATSWKKPSVSRASSASPRATCSSTRAPRYDASPGESRSAVARWSSSPTDPSRPCIRARSDESLDARSALKPP
ncbi:MAG: hypothetical protein IPN17_26560 [Deltaproteobacteria bacterium]|nr:hypothetical protein [Deltaproteobacteria bacterium]